MGCFGSLILDYEVRFLLAKSCVSLMANWPSRRLFNGFSWCPFVELINFFWFNMWFFKWGLLEIWFGSSGLTALVLWYLMIIVSVMVALPYDWCFNVVYVEGSIGLIGIDIWCILITVLTVSTEAFYLYLIFDFLEFLLLSRHTWVSSSKTINCFTTYNVHWSMFNPVVLYISWKGEWRDVRRNKKAG